MTKEAQGASGRRGTTQTRGTYVYGIVRAGTSLDSIGGDDELPDVRLVEAGKVAALVSDGPERATRELVLGHGRVLDRVLESSPVVPLRFGMVLTDEDAVRDEILEAHQEELTRLLKRFKGRVQMTLKVYYHEDAVMADILTADPQLARLRAEIHGRPEAETYKQRVTLGEKLNAAVEKRRKLDGKEILDRLQPVAEGVSLEPPEDELMVAHAAFLLPRDRMDEFDATLEELAGERADLMRFRLLGPMPAYNFIDFEGPS